MMQTTCASSLCASACLWAGLYERLRFTAASVYVLSSFCQAFVSKLDIARPVSAPDFRAPRRSSLGECMAESVIYHPISHRTI